MPHNNNVDFAQTIQNHFPFPFIHYNMQALLALYKFSIHFAHSFILAT